MNNNTVRILGIIAGILAGTIAALLFRGPWKSTAGHDDKKTQSSYIDDDDPVAKKRPPDPGMRNEIKRMVAEAKKEEAWLKEFELTERSGRLIKSGG